MLLVPLPRRLPRMLRVLLPRRHQRRPLRCIIAEIQLPLPQPNQQELLFVVLMAALAVQPKHQQVLLRKHPLADPLEAPVAAAEPTEILI